MAISRNRKIAVGVFIAVVLTVVLVMELTTIQCNLRRCRLPAIMMQVAQAQLDVERQMKAGTAMALREAAVPSRYLSSSYALANGTIVIESDELLVMFEPQKTGGDIEWRCAGRPKSLFDEKFPLGISDCGRRYRMIFAGQPLNASQL